MQQRKLKVGILGEMYSVEYHGAEDVKLEECDGYCDWTTKTIVIRKNLPDSPRNLGSLYEYQMKVLRHELIHAFLFESGLAENSWGTNEEIVDWIALQFDKIVNAFDSVAVLNEEEINA